LHEWTNVGKGKDMSRPAPEDLKLIHPEPGNLGEPSKFDLSGALIEAYKKHAEELRGIEDRQSKTVALLLGILSAAGTLLLKPSVHLTLFPKLYISAVALVIVYVGNHAINEFHDLRTAVRDLLVRCEVALRFHEAGVFLEGKPLYTQYELGYANRGAWMKQNRWIIWFVCAAFLLLLWIK
jgi:hypothetical protein